jgi:hypothetical protein
MDDLKLANPLVRSTVGIWAIHFQHDLYLGQRPTKI